mmetsp:Transcript_87362/g.157361  ORF Transcript_87362/g.157361 Transcript_87362/m.157361 type:complete len:247 (+) Transcript_87362:475-1215(+)
MDLHPFKVDGLCADGLTQLDAVPGGVVAVGGGQVHEVGPVLGQQRSVGEISPKAASGQDHRSILLELLAFLYIRAAHASAGGVHEQFLNLGLVDDACKVGRLRDLLHHLDEGIGDGHSRKALLATVGSRSGVATETSKQGHVQVKLVHEPVHIPAAVAAQDFYQLRLLSTTLERVRCEECDGILGLQCLLRLGLGTVDATRGLGGIAATEGRLVDQNNLSAKLQDGVRCCNTGETSTDDNGLHHAC